MRNFRVVKSNRDSEYYVQYQFLGRWFYVRDENAYSMLSLNYNTFTNWKFLLAVSNQLILWTWFGLIVQREPTTLGIILCCLGIFGAVYSILFLLDFFSCDVKYKQQFYSENDAKRWIMRKVKEMKEKEEADNRVKKKGDFSVSGVYINGEYIDGKRLERWKKLERIIDEGQTV